MTDDKIVESNIESKDTTTSETDPEKIRELDNQLMPWVIDTAFKTFHALYVLSEEAKNPVSTEEVAKELRLEEDRVVSLIKVARTMINNPMPSALSRVCAMYKDMSAALYDIKNESVDTESVRIATELLARVEAEDTPSHPLQAD